MEVNYFGVDDGRTFKLVRKVHFSFVLLCTTCGYLILSNWTDNRAIAESIRNFRSFIQQLKFVDELDCVKDSVDAIKKSIETAIKNEVDIDTVEFFKFYEFLNSDVKQTTENPLPEFVNLDTNATISSIAEMLTKSDLKLSGIKKIKDSLDDVRKHRDDISATKLTVNIAWWGDTTAVLTLYGSGSEETFIKKFEPFEFDCLTYDSLFKSGYKPMFESWDQIKNRSVTGAIKWAEDQPVESIGSLNLFGVQIGSGSIGLMLLGLAFSFLFYMLAYLSEIKQIVSNSQLSPWVGTMQNGWAGVVAAVTFWLGPCLAIGLPLLKLVAVSWVDAVCIFIIGQILSLRCWWLARNIALADRVGFNSVTLLRYLRYEFSFGHINIILQHTLSKESKKLNQERLKEIIDDEEKNILDAGRLMKTNKIPSSKFLNALNLIMMIPIKIGVIFLPKKALLQVTKELKCLKMKKLLQIGDPSLKDILSTCEKQMTAFELLITAQATLPE